ncbi:hypothetical protein [Agromyces larvae]|uniref:hypothetical protein n=1 Tax=Agromyces larvae TaxID=2929802 RepID=UPI0025B730E1|nr:hypothetical protein [Agromyces larvae]
MTDQTPQPLPPDQPDPRTGYPQPGYAQPGSPQPAYPQPGSPQQPAYPQPGYPQPAYPQQWAPVPAPAPRPPLEPRSRTGALVGGGVGLTLVTWGLGLAAFGAIFGIVALILAAVAGAVRAGDDGDNAFTRFIDAVPMWLVIAVIAGAVVVGAALVVGGVLGQRAILRRHGVHRPTAVTWSSLGIGVVANGTIGGVLSAPASILPGVWSRSSDSAPGVLLLIGASVVGVAVTAAIGAFASWWMAHAFRSAQPAASAAAAPAAPAATTPDQPGRPTAG